MAWSAGTSLGTAHNNVGNSVLTVSATAPIGAVVVVVSAETANGSTTGPGTIADSAGNTWHREDFASLNNGVGTGYAAVFWSVLTTALTSGSSTITYTNNVSTRSSTISAEYWTGGATVSPVNVVATHVTGSSTSASISATPSLTGVLFVGALGVSSSDTFTQGSGFTTGPVAAASTPEVYGGSQVDATTATMTWAPSWLVSKNYAAFLLGFAPNPSPTLAVTSGSFSLTGEPATSSSGISASSGSFAETGEAAPLTPALNSITGLYHFTGEPALLGSVQFFPVDGGVYTLTGEAATFSLDIGMPGAFGSYALTGEPVTVNFNLRTLNQALSTAHYSLTGKAATFFTSAALVADAGSYHLIGSGAVLINSGMIVVPASSLVLTPYNPLNYPQIDGGVPIWHLGQNRAISSSIQQLIDAVSNLDSRARANGI